MSTVIVYWVALESFDEVAVWWNGGMVEGT